MDGRADKETGNAGECHSDGKSLPERAGVCSLCTPGEEKAISVHPICTQSNKAAWALRGDKSSSSGLLLNDCGLIEGK